MHRLGSVAGMLVVLGCGASATTPRHAAPATYTVIDLGPALVDALDAAAEEPDAERRIAIVRRTLVDQHAEVFTADVLGLTDEATLDRRVAQMLDAAVPRRDEIRAVATAVRTELPMHQRRFMEAFPDFAYRGRVYFTASLDGFDGAVRRVDGDLALLFGLDGIVLRHAPGARIGALFVHELFHLHHHALHASWASRPPRMIDALWGEGLAVWVARRLVPDVTLDELGLSTEMVEGSDARMREIAAELLEARGSQDEALYAEFFLRRGSGRVPIRCGYYVGMRVAERVARAHADDLGAVVRLDGDALDREIEAALIALRDGEP